MTLEEQALINEMPDSLKACLSGLECAIRNQPLAQRRAAERRDHSQECTMRAGGVSRAQAEANQRWRER